MAVARTATIVATDSLIDNVRGRTIQNVKVVCLEFDAETDATDTFSFDMADYGATTLLGCDGVSHQTANSVMIADNPTTTVSGTTVSGTVPSGTDDDNRFYKFYIS